MSRRRKISTDISTDPKILDLLEYGTLPPLLYTWSIPHMDDWGRMTGNPRQFKLLVCPGIELTADQISEALDQIASVGLWQRYSAGGKECLAIPEESWYKHQSYINKEKRNNGGSDFPPPPEQSQQQEQEKPPLDEEEQESAVISEEQQETTENGEEEQETARITASLSLSPSLSPSRSKHMPYSGEFEQFWSVYPRKVGKKRAFGCWEQRIRGDTPDDLIQAAKNYAEACQIEKTEMQFIKHPSTFLSAKEDYRDYVEKAPPTLESSPSLLSGKPNPRDETPDDWVYIPPKDGPLHPFDPKIKG